MKIKLWVGIFLFLGIIACEKTPNEPASETKKDISYFPLSTGSYWVNNTYQIDSTENETLISENDTMRIIGDSVINGNTYKVFYGKETGIAQGLVKRFFRDSSGCIVNNSGKIFFSINNFIDTLYSSFTTWDSNVYMYSLMETYENEISLSSGVFDSILNWELTVERHGETKSLIRKNAYLFVPNVGKILCQYFYISTFERNKNYYEERLIDYYIAE